MEILCFFLGVAAFYLKSILAVAGLCLFLFFRWRTGLIVSFMLGLGVSAIHEWHHTSDGFGKLAVLSRAHVQGEIVSIPVQRSREVSQNVISSGATSFEFLVNTLNGKPAHARVLLTCYEHCPIVHAGESWQFQVRLKKTRNYRNPGGFDYAASMRARHIDWVGYIIRGEYKRIVPKKPSSNSLLTLRESLAQMLEKLESNTTYLGILQALTVGVTQHIDQSTWALFRRTGTTHLMVISGAHIGFIAGLSFSLFKIIWSRLGRMAEVIPSSRIASFVSLCMGLFYAMIAGFGAPAERAIVAFSVLSVRYFSNIRFSIWQAWQSALLFVLLFEPHAVLQPGFYLSFIAVAILIAMNQRLSITGVKKTVSLQLACMIGLMPLTLFWFSYGSLNGFFANLLAIPWVSFVVIPLGLIITLLGYWFPMAWAIVIENHAMAGLLAYLQWIDSFSIFNLTYPLSSLFSVLLLMTFFFATAFIPIKSWYWVLSVLFISAWMPVRHRVIGASDARVDVLDVGQGLAVVVRTLNHVLVYDTGMQFYQGTDMGKLVIIPYLRSQKIQKIDKVVISHPDLDHRGGLRSLSDSVPIHELLVDDPRQYRYARSCHEYPAWRWDGVLFKFFSIDADFSGHNNRSCVLQISNSSGAVLLTGDIEHAAEDYLVNRYGASLVSSVMLIPHHASKTSSTAYFVKAVKPQYAVVSYGFDNRYHFPHPEAMAVYKHQKIPVFSTEACGFIRISLKHQDKSPKVQCNLRQ
jgi:competence protein ComEC